MSMPSSLAKLTGKWVGYNRLWLYPGDPAHESDTTASVALISQGKFLSLGYTWVYDNQLQDGYLLIGQEIDQDPFKAVWIDSWHMGHQMMRLQGNLDARGVLSLLGSYAAHPGSNWGWRIILEPEDNEHLRFCMMNIPPDGKEVLAVEAHFRLKPKVKIVPYKDSWPGEFQTIASTLRQGLGDLAVRIDHIGSTSVPGLAAKDIIDIQITVVNLDHKLLSAMRALGYTQPEGIWRDHRPAQMEGPETDWEKWYLHPPEVQRRTHMHVRVQGRPNQRYPLLFRDYLRTHPATAESYAELKRRLADNLEDSLTYPEVKDPAVDLIYLAAEEWAAATGWQPGPSDG